MVPTILLLLLALCGAAGAAEPDPSALVEALRSGLPAERDEAAGALEESGRRTLPALYAARDSGDASFRERVALLIDLVERQRLLRPTRVALDVEGRPLAEVVADLAEQSGFAVALEPADDPDLSGRPVTLRAGPPLPFWEALDRLGVAAGVRDNPGPPLGPRRHSPRISLVADRGPPVPACYAGPFRMNLVALGRHRQVTLGPKAGQATVEDRLSATLQVFAEPGLVIHRIAAARLEEAVNDIGDDLRGATAERAPPAHFGPTFESGNLSIVQESLALKPAGPGGRRLRLRGSVFLSVIARTDGPLTLPLNMAGGAASSGGGVTVKVTAIERSPEQTAIELDIRDETCPARPLPGPGAARLGKFVPPFRLEDHLRILDGQQRPCTWSAVRSSYASDGTVRARLSVRPETSGTPSELRYHQVVGAAVEVPFAFDELPMP